MSVALFIISSLAALAVVLALNWAIRGYEPYQTNNMAIFTMIVSALVVAIGIIVVLRADITDNLRSTCLQLVAVVLFIVNIGSLTDFGFMLIDKRRGDE